MKSDSSLCATDVMKADDTFGNATREGALKAILKNDAPR
jgi:hypothetical protein